MHPVLSTSYKQTHAHTDRAKTCSRCLSLLLIKTTVASQAAGGTRDQCLSDGSSCSRVHVVPQSLTWPEPSLTEPSHWAHTWPLSLSCTWLYFLPSFHPFVHFLTFPFHTICTEIRAVSIYPSHTLHTPLPLTHTEHTISASLAFVYERGSAFCRTQALTVTFHCSAALHLDSVKGGRWIKLFLWSTKHF